MQVIFDERITNHFRHGDGVSSSFLVYLLLSLTKVTRARQICYQRFWLLRRLLVRTSSVYICHDGHVLSSKLPICHKITFHFISIKSPQRDQISKTICLKLIISVDI